MDAVLRGLAIYVILLLLFRLTGRRTLAELTAFDFVLLLIIGEATQQALLGQDYSLTNAVLVIVTLLFTDVMMSLVKRSSPKISKVLDGVPTIIVENGKPLKDCMHKARIDEDDVLAAARHLQGIERMEQIRYAVLEISGGITVIPYDQPRSSQE